MLYLRLWEKEEESWWVLYLRLWRKEGILVGVIPPSLGDLDHNEAQSGLFPRVCVSPTTTRFTVGELFVRHGFSHYSQL